MGMLPPILVELKANASEFMSKMGDAQDKIDKLGKQGATTGQMIKEHLGQGLMVSGAAATAAGAVLLEFGEKGERAHKELEVAVKNAGQTYEEFGKQIGQAVTHQEKFGHTADDTQSALAILTRATGDTKKSLADMSLVTEIAAVHHSSLADAAELVGKMHAGSTKALKEFGINVADNKKAVTELNAASNAWQKAEDGVSAAQKKLADLLDIQHSKSKLTEADHIALKNAQDAVAAAKSHDEDATRRLDAAQAAGAKTMDFAAEKTAILEKIHGTAAAQADTFGGHIAALKAHMEDMAMTVGQKVGPALTVAGPLMLGVGTIIQSGVVPMVAKAVVSFGEMAASALAAFASMIAEAAVWAASMVASAAIAMAPFLPLIALVAAVGIAAFELYEHWDQVWGFIKGITKAAFDFVKQHMDLIIAVALGPVGIAIVLLKDHWSEVWGAIKAVVTGAWDTIRNVVGAGIGFVKDLFGREVDGWKRIWDDVWHGIEDTVSNVWHGISSVVRGGINELIGAINTLIRGLDSIQIHIPTVGVGPIHTPGFDWGGMGIPTIPELRAMGGPVDAWSPYIVGERGPELFVPGSSGSIVPNRALGGGGTTNHYEITVVTTGLGATAPDIQKAVVEAIRGYEQSNGKGWRTAA